MLEYEIITCAQRLRRRQGIAQGNHESGRNFQVFEDAHPERHQYAEARILHAENRTGSKPGREEVQGFGAQRKKGGALQKLRLDRVERVP